MCQFTCVKIIFVVVFFAL